MLRLYTEVLLLDRAMMMTHFNPSTITTNAVDRNVFILLAGRVASIQHHTYSTISVCPLRCLSSTLCTFYSIRMDPLTKTCFCGLVIKAIQSSKYKAYSIEHFYWMTDV